MRLPLLLLYCLLSSWLAAQSTDKLLLRDGTTVRGVLRHVPPRLQGVRLRFQARGGEVRTYTPREVLHCRVGRTGQLVKAVSVELPQAGGGAEQTRYRFGEVIASGEVELIRVPLAVSEYTPEAIGSQPYLYVLRQDDVELILKLSTIEVYGQLHANPSRFRNLLKYLVRGCERATELARTAQFKNADILRVLVAYRDCQPAAVVLNYHDAQLRGGTVFDHYLRASTFDMRDGDFSQDQLSLGIGYQIEARMTQRLRRLSLLGSVDVLHHTFTSPRDLGTASQTMLRGNFGLAVAPVQTDELALKLALGLSNYHALSSNLRSAFANNYFLFTADVRLHYRRWLLELGYEHFPDGHFRRPNALLRLGVGYRLFPTE